MKVNILGEISSLGLATVASGWASPGVGSDSSSRRVDTPNIGVAITHKDRPDTLAINYAMWARSTPDDCPIVVIDDGSSCWQERGVPRPNVVHPRSPETSVGIPRAKNRAIESLMNLGVEHLFIVDDDCYPFVDNWWQPYVDSPFPHLQAIFTDPGGTSAKRLFPSYLDDRHVSYDGGRGYFLYFHRSAIDRVGGFDPAFGVGGWEHINMSDRIFTAGLTPRRFIDVTAKTIQSMDEYYGTVSTLPERSREDKARARGYRLKKMHTDYYIDYRSAQ